MVQEIIKIIDEKIEREIEKINQEKEKKILELEKDYESKLKDLNNLNLQKFKKEMDSEAEGFLQQKKMELNFALEKEKNIIVNDIYKKAEEKILSQSAEGFEEMIKKLVGFVKKDEKGEILAGPKTAAILKNILSLQVFKIKDTLQEEGFLLKGQDVDIDFRISQLLLGLKEKQNPEVVKLLFS